MWKRGGQSCALDRAQALLSAQRNSRGSGLSTHGSPAKTKDIVDGSIKPRPASQNAHLLLSDLSDLSSLSSAPDHGADTSDPAPPEKNQSAQQDSKNLRPQSSLGGEGSRFLKKAPPPVANSSQSPVSKSHMQQMPEPRYVSSFQRGSQAAALSRLAHIESRFRSRKQPHGQARQGPDASHELTADLGISPPPGAVTQSSEVSVPISAASSSDQSLKGKRFLKKKAATNVDTSNAAAPASPKCQDASVRSQPRAAAAAVPLVDLDTKSVRVARGVSLESDEEDMKKLLGASPDSTDNSFLRPEKITSIKKTDMMLGQTVPSNPRPAAGQPASSNAARSPASHRSSPFRFTGQAQAHFSPSALSPSPSPPSVSPSFPRRRRSPHRSVSAMSGRSEVLSLEELFPVQPPSEALHSDTSVVSSEDFKVKVMSLDDLVPASVGSTEGTLGKQREEHNPPLTGSTERHKEHLRYKDRKQQQEEEEEVLDYQSDFESESCTEGNYSASQVSEQLPGDGVGEEAVSEVRDGASVSDVSHVKTEDDYLNTLSDLSRSRLSHRSDASESLSRSRDSRSSASHGGETSSQQRRAAARGVLKEAAVQTRHERTAYTWSTGGPYMTPTSVAAHTLSAETVEALSSYNPAAFVINEILKQQLAATRRFIESSRHFHTSMLRSLEPPNYRYTKLEDTKEYIRRHRVSRLTVQDMSEHHCTT